MAECNHCGKNISVWATPYSVGDYTLCKDCFGDTELMARLKDERGQPLSPEQAERIVAAGIALTTTESVPGLEAEAIIGLVFGEAVIGANIFTDMLAGVRDVVGGRSGSYQNRFREAREIAVEEMAINAHRRGADAVVGVRIDYEMVRESMMMVTASGTAVKIAFPDRSASEGGP